MIFVGTAHYTDIVTAERYYGAGLQTALDEGAIFIGRPTPPPGWRIGGVRDGRYVITEENK